MSFDKHGNFVRHPNVNTKNARAMEISKQGTRENNEKKCTEDVLQRLLEGPVEAEVLWKELEPYEDVRRSVVDGLIGWAIVRPKFVWPARGQKNSSTA